MWDPVRGKVCDWPQTKPLEATSSCRPRISHLRKVIIQPVRAARVPTFIPQACNGIICRAALPPATCIVTHIWVHYTVSCDCQTVDPWVATTTFAVLWLLSSLWFESSQYYRLCSTRNPSICAVPQMPRCLAVPQISICRVVPQIQALYVVP